MVTKITERIERTMKLERKDRFQGRYLPPFFKADWEVLSLSDSKGIWDTVSQLPEIRETLNKYSKSSFINPGQIEGRSLLLKPYGYDVYILDFELVKNDDVIALPILMTDKGIIFEADRFFIDTILDNGLDERLIDVLIHNLSHLDDFMRFHVTNEYGASRGQRNIIVESLEDLRDWYDISNLDPRLIHLPAHNISEFETKFNTGVGGFRKYVGYSCKVIGWDNHIRTLHDTYCKNGWRSHSDYDQGNDDFYSEEPEDKAFDLSLSKQNISRGPLRYYL